ncbi:MAG: PA14 domain-containing protein, partial [Bacteroidales bacterium]
ISDSVYLEQGIAYYFESFCKGYYWNNCCNPWIKTNIKGNYLKIGWVMPGTSNLTVIPWNNVRPAGPRTVHGVQWEIFENQSAYDFDDLKNSASIPNEVIRLDSLSTTNYATTKDHFSSRIRGYLVAPVTGEYTFCFACDNVGQFWLSPDTLPENAQIKSDITYCQPDWLQNTSVQTLVAGQRYFFEILHYDTVYTDLIKLGWKIPGDTLLQVIRHPYVLNYNSSATVQSFTLLDHEATAFPEWNFTPRYHLAPWNVRNKSISWTTSNHAVANVSADGIINMVSPGVCYIVARPVGNQALSDSVLVTVTNYYGPYFVKQNASENGDGHSWENAISLTKLLSILSQGTLSQRALVCVAEGIYKPTTTIDQNQTFGLNNTRIVGGFANSITGNDTTSRNYANHETILSGEIGFAEETIDNCFHVVVAQNNSIINGFTIRDGRASCSSHGWTPGLSYYKRDDNGGGIIAEGGNLTIENCKITNNAAWNSGGGLSCRGANAKVVNCEIYANKSISEAIGTGGWFNLIINTHGAGISASYNSVLNITGCQIHNNSAMGTASAIFQSGSVVNVQKSAIFDNNGGGNSIVIKDGSSMNMNNVTIKGDVVYFFYPSGNIENTTIDGKLDVGYCYSKNAISLDNCIITGFYPTVVPSSSSYYNLADSVFTAKYCILGNSLFGASKEALISDSLPESTTWLDTLA